MLSSRPCTKATLLQFLAAINIATAAAGTAPQQASLPAALTALSSVQLLLGAGCAFLAHLSGWDDDAAACGASTLAPQIAFVRQLLDVATRTGVLPQFAQQLATPQATATWLLAAVAGAQKVLGAGPSGEGCLLHGVSAAVHLAG